MHAVAPGTGTVIGSWTRALIHFAGQSGIEQSLLLAGTDLNAADLEDDAARIPRDLDTQLWERAASLTGDPAIGFEMARQTVRAATFGVVGFASMASPTLLEAVRCAVRLHRLVSDTYFRVRGVDFLEVTMSPGPGHCPWPGPLAEAIAIAVVQLARDWTGCAEPLLRACFQHPKPAHADVLAEYLGVAPRFSHDENAIIFSGDMMRAPLRMADPELWAYLWRQARRQLDHQLSSTDFDAALHSAIASALAEGVLSLAEVARSLGVRPRTLQRRLRERGIAYRDAVDAVRMQQARQLLGEGSLPVAQVARRLGFAEAGSFRRAFHRWIGVSPSGYRTEAAAAGSLGSW